MNTSSASAAPHIQSPTFSDDVEITSISVPGVRFMSDHVLYMIDCENIKLRKSFSTWTVMKRYNQFHELDSQLREDFQHSPYFLSTLPTPPQRQLKLLVDHNDEHFVQHRRVLLEHYLQQLIKIPQVAKNQHFLHFLGIGGGM